MADKLKKEKGAEIGGEAGFGSLPSETNEEKKIKDNAKKLYPVSEKDIKILKESGTNSYSSDNKKMIKALKKD